MGKAESIREQEVMAELAASDLGVRQRRALLAELRNIGSERSIPILRAHVGGADLRCQVAATFALAAIGTDEAVDVLIECLAVAPGPQLTAAIHWLGKVGVPRAVPDLVRTLEDRGSELGGGDKQVIIAALAKWPHRSEVPILAAMLRERSWRTRGAAAAVLGQIRAPESRAALEEATKSLSWFRALPARRALRRRGYESDG